MKEPLRPQKCLYLCVLLSLSFISFSQFSPFNLQKTEKHLGLAGSLSNRQINVSFLIKQSNSVFDG